MPEIIRLGSIEIRFLRSKHDTAGSLDMFEMICQPKARMPVPHYHRDWDESIYGLAGVTTFTIDGKPVDIAPGDHVFIPRGVVHGFDIRGAEVAKCLCVLTPGSARPRIFPRDRRTGCFGPARSGEDARDHGAPWPRPCPGLTSRMIPKSDSTFRMRSCAEQRPGRACRTAAQLASLSHPPAPRPASDPRSDHPYSRCRSRSGSCRHGCRCGREARPARPNGSWCPDGSRAIPCRRGSPRA